MIPPLSLCFVVALVLLQSVFSQGPPLTDTATSRYVIYSNNFEKPSTYGLNFFQSNNFQQQAGVGMGGSVAGTAPATQFGTGIFGQIRSGDETHISFHINPNNVVLGSAALIVSLINGTNSIFTELFLGNASIPRYSNAQGHPYSVSTPNGFNFGIPGNAWTKVTVGSKKGAWDALYVNGNLVNTFSQTAAGLSSSHSQASAGLYEGISVGWMRAVDSQTISRFS